MTDKELIEFLYNLLAADLTDGDTPSEKEWKALKQELVSRDIDTSLLWPE